MDETYSWGVETPVPEKPTLTPAEKKAKKEAKQAKLLAAKEYWGKISQTVGSIPSSYPEPFSVTRAKAARKIISLDQLTDAEWSQMDGKARWDSMVALRGPDYLHSERVKQVTTSVIRYRMGGIMRVGGMVNRTLPFVILPDNSQANSSGPFDWCHFLGHVQEAAQWLNIPICWVPSSAWFSVVLGHSSLSWEHSLYSELAKHVKTDPFQKWFEAYLPPAKETPGDGEEALS